MIAAAFRDEPLPTIPIESPDGARAELHLEGGHLTSWRPAGAGEQLYLSPRADFEPGLPIRGGVPIVFPQFSSEGPLPKHGFARTSRWEVVSIRPGEARLRLVDSEATRALWPWPFRLDLAVAVEGSSLLLELSVMNPGPRAFRFQAALHTYLAVRDVGAATITGLRGLRFVERAGGRRVPGLQSEPELRFTEELDRTYLGAPAELAVREPRRTVHIRTTGFPDTVVWNPGAELAARIPDLGPGQHRRFVCVEAAAVTESITLEPGARWRGSQALRVG